MIWRWLARWCCPDKAIGGMSKTLDPPELRHLDRVLDELFIELERSGGKK